MNKVLFILKRREDFNAKKHNHVGLSTGLYNSASFVHQMLLDLDIPSALEVAIDNNCIDRLVNQHQPSHVIIEALWVVPQKFAVLQKLHPMVTWIIRLHSEMPFMAGEGMAMDWLGDYSRFSNILIGINAPRMLGEIRLYLGHLNNWSQAETKRRVIYMPNFYPQEHVTKSVDRDKSVIDVGCFGAVRLLKNHVVQAFAAIQFAENNNKRLRFHINAGRIEMQGQPVLNNLKGMFQQIHGLGHELVNHTWVPRQEFLKICADMDVGMQASLSETFNIVGADLISQGVPVVGTKEIPWLPGVVCADPTSSQDIAKKLQLAYDHPESIVEKSQFSLNAYTSEVKEIWHKYFRSPGDI